MPWHFWGGCEIPSGSPENTWLKFEWEIGGLSLYKVWHEPWRTEGM